MSDLTLPVREKSLSTTQTMSPPNPATPPKNGACLWWALPKEISDEILQLAYGTPDKPMSMLDEPAFVCMQRDKAFDCDDEDKPFEVSPYTSPAKSPHPTSFDDASQPPFSSLAQRLTPSPQPRQYERYIDRLLVSKKWHREATAALFAVTPVAITASDSTFFNLNPRISLAHQRPFPGLSLVTSVHIASLDQAAKFARLLATQCPALRRLHVQGSPLEIRMPTSVRWLDLPSCWQACHVRWTEQDVRESAWFEDVAVLSGLESVELGLSEKPCLSIFERMPWEVVVMAENWGLVRRLFVESATRPRDLAVTREDGRVCRLRVPKRG
jgi:hypothetical protein